MQYDQLAAILAAVVRGTEELMGEVALSTFLSRAGRGSLWLDPQRVSQWFLPRAEVHKDRFLGRGWYVCEPDGLLYMTHDGRWTYGISEDTGYFWERKSEAVEAVKRLLTEMPTESTMRHRVYIACPISNGDTDHRKETYENNFKKAVKAFNALVEVGLAPLNPGFTVKHPDPTSIPYSDWMEIDKPWVLCSEAVFRVEGESKGADDEVQTAFEAGIPVFYDVDSIAHYFGLRSCNGKCRKELCGAGEGACRCAAHVDTESD